MAVVFAILNIVAGTFLSVAAVWYGMVCKLLCRKFLGREIDELGQGATLEDLETKATNAKVAVRVIWDANGPRIPPAVVAKECAKQSLEWSDSFLSGIKRRTVFSTAGFGVCVVGGVMLGLELMIVRRNFDRTSNDVVGRLVLMSFCVHGLLALAQLCVFIAGEHIRLHLARLSRFLTVVVRLGAAENPTKFRSCFGLWAFLPELVGAGFTNTTPAGESRADYLIDKVRRSLFVKHVTGEEASSALANSAATAVAGLLLLGIQPMYVDQGGMAINILAGSVTAQVASFFFGIQLVRSNFYVTRGLWNLHKSVVEMIKEVCESAKWNDQQGTRRERVTDLLKGIEGEKPRSLQRREIGQEVDRVLRQVQAVAPEGGFSVPDMRDRLIHECCRVRAAVDEHRILHNLGTPDCYWAKLMALHATTKVELEEDLRGSSQDTGDLQFESLLTFMAWGQVILNELTIRVPRTGDPGVSDAADPGASQSVDPRVADPLVSDTHTAVGQPVTHSLSPAPTVCPHNNPSCDPWEERGLGRVLVALSCKDDTSYWDLYSSSTPSTGSPATAARHLPKGKTEVADVGDDPVKRDLHTLVEVKSEADVITTVLAKELLENLLHDILERVEVVVLILVLYSLVPNSPLDTTVKSMLRACINEIFDTKRRV